MISSASWITLVSAMTILLSTRRHAIYLIIALIAGFIASKVSVELWQRSDKYLLLLSFIVLTLIIIPGVGVQLIMRLAG